LAAESSFDSVAAVGCGSAPEIELDAGSDEARLDLADPDHSLRAQPLPLKWTAEATIAFFIGPPHELQAEGPWPWME
jgi:hypothetical protein